MLLVGSGFRSAGMASRRGPGSTALFARVFLSRTWLWKVRVVIFHIRVGRTVTELAIYRRPARCGAGRLFFNDTFVFVAIVVFGHRSVGMRCAAMPLYSSDIATTGMPSVWG